MAPPKPKPFADGTVMSRRSIPEMVERADLLAEDILRVIRAHTDSLEPRDVGGVSTMAATYVLADVVFAIGARAGISRTVEQVVGSILLMPWKTTVELVMEKARDERPR
jgi:hypothetical protein